MANCIKCKGMANDPRGIAIIRLTPPNERHDKKLKIDCSFGAARDLFSIHALLTGTCEKFTERDE